MRDIEGDEVGLRETMKERDRKKGVFVCVCVCEFDNHSCKSVAELLSVGY